MKRKTKRAMVNAILEQTPPDPRTIRAEIPKPLETIILNCISRHPPERYQTADALLADLLEVQQWTEGSINQNFDVLRLLPSDTKECEI